MFQLSRDSPTPSRLSEAIILAFAAAGANGEVNGERGFWKLWISDAKSAFLQRERNHEERDGPLFMYPPKDPLMLATGAFSAELYEVLGNCFGLPDAPRLWCTSEPWNVASSSTPCDKCLYYYNDDHGRLRALLIVHVDDFLCTYHPDFDEGILKNMFIWGSVTIVEVGKPGGKEITEVARNQRFFFKVTQDPGLVYRGHVFRNASSRTRQTKREAHPRRVEGLQKCFWVAAVACFSVEAGGLTGC